MRWIIMVLLAAIGAGIAVSAWLERTLPAAIEAPGPVASQPRITLVAAHWCGYCRKLRADLEAANVPYSWIDSDSAAGRRLMSRHDAKGVPLTIVGPHVVYGYNVSELERIFISQGYDVY